MKIYIVIPAYNAEKTLKNVLQNLNRACYRNIVVVDDGSRDNTYNVAKKIAKNLGKNMAKNENIFVLKHFLNRGQGAALKTGIDFALNQGADIIVTFDSDGQHRVEDLLDLIAPVANGEVDVALGSRFLSKDNIKAENKITIKNTGSKNPIKVKVIETPNTKVPVIRKALLKSGAVVTWMTYGIKLTDSHNGLRALSRKAAEQINITSDRMEHASQIVEEIKNKDLKYREIPVLIRYTNYSKHHGQSSLNAVRIFSRMIYRKLTE